MPIYLPPLRNRLEDLPNLIDYFINIFNNKNMSNLSTDNSALNFLKTYDWPGNIQELKNLIERLSLSLSNGKITVPDLKYQLKNTFETNQNEENITFESLVNKRINMVMSSINDDSSRMNL